MNQRTNIYSTNLAVCRNTATKTVHVYEDHRVLLCTLFDARQKQILHGPVNLVYFDYHADARARSEDAAIQAQLHQFRGNLPQARDFWSFVEFDAATDDGDWLKLGMELGLIRDALVVRCVQDDGLNGELQHLSIMSASSIAFSTLGTFGK